MTKRRPPDSRLAAARYALDREVQDDEEPTDRGQISPDQRAQAVEIAIQQAMRRGEFDDLPGAGKPLADLGTVRDPDWWIRRKIERENLTGLGPPALTLRTEDARLSDRLDELPTEARVREALDDFNHRVREARRQLLGGPPVITRPRDVEAELEAWRTRALERRAARERAQAEERECEAAALAAMTWRERRRAKRSR
ncbi:hypothetical protein GCM10025783_32920 [Amnibacterium soli]|uniref:DnaJ homologue subfamily C member 28 conserved domain-containing protein n=1 Tax=Amnibacterium soli TaxID=1282736 RepID=A0ABP8ZHF2_9MICO